MKEYELNILRMYVFYSEIWGINQIHWRLKDRKEKEESQERATRRLQRLWDFHVKVAPLQ